MRKYLTLFTSKIVYHEISDITFFVSIRLGVEVDVFFYYFGGIYHIKTNHRIFFFFYSIIIIRLFYFCMPTLNYSRRGKKKKRLWKNLSEKRKKNSIYIIGFSVIFFILSFSFRIFIFISLEERKKIKFFHLYFYLSYPLFLLLYM